MGRKAPPSRTITIGWITGYLQASIDEPFEYLGIPIFHGRMLISYFSKLLNKIRLRIDGWGSKLLTMGARRFLLGVYYATYRDISCQCIQFLKRSCVVWKTCYHLLYGAYIRASLGRDGNHGDPWLYLLVGGLGFRSISSLIHVLRMKVMWSMLESNSM